MYKSQFIQQVFNSLGSGVLISDIIKTEWRTLIRISRPPTKADELIAEIENETNPQRQQTRIRFTVHSVAVCELWRAWRLGSIFREKYYLYHKKRDGLIEDSDTPVIRSVSAIAIQKAWEAKLRYKREINHILGIC